MQKHGLTLSTLTLALLLVSPFTLAEPLQYKLTIKDHHFSPAEITIPANTRVTLFVHNADSDAEEFHSDSLHREKIIGPKMTGKINIGPLAPGIYPFMGEFHMRTAQGKVIVK